MTLGSPIVVAFIRGLLTALGQAMFTGIVTYQATGSGEDAVLVGALTFLSALGIRGGVEGVYDQRRSRPESEAQPGYYDPVPENRIVRRVEDMAVHDALVVAQEPAAEAEDPEVGYHFSPKDGKRHRGGTSTCPVCIHDGYV